MTTHQKLTGVALISLSALCLTVTFAAQNVDNLSNVLAFNRTVSSADYTTEFSMRTSIDGVEKLLTYNGGQTITEAANVAESMCKINFIDNDTITIQCGEYSIGYDSKTNLKNDITEWDLVNGQVQYMAGTTNRTLSYRTSTYNVGRPYAVSNIDDVEYYQIYFYSTTQYNEAAGRCMWGTGTDRQVRLANLAYEVPTPVVKYTITYDANGGTGTMDPVVKAEGTEYQLLNNAFIAPNGKKFKCWKIGDTEYDPNDKVIVNSNLTVIAQWEDKPQELQNPIVFSTLGLTNGVQYLDPFQGDGFTVTFAGGANDGKYYTTGAGIRVYGNGTMTIESSNYMTSITITYDGSNKPTSADVVNIGSYNVSTGTWTGNAKTVVFTRPSGSGHWRVKSVEVSFN